MNCGFDREQLSLYADGALMREHVTYLETHVAECKECRQELEDIRKIGTAVHSLPREVAPRELIERIIAEACRNAHRPAWYTVKLAAGAIGTAAVHGFRIEDDRAELLRRELPGWLARWVLFV